MGRILPNYLKKIYGKKAIEEYNNKEQEKIIAELRAKWKRAGYKPIETLIKKKRSKE